MQLANEAMAKNSGGADASDSTMLRVATSSDIQDITDVKHAAMEHHRVFFEAFYQESLRCVLRYQTTGAIYDPGKCVIVTEIEGQIVGFMIFGLCGEQGHSERFANHSAQAKPHKVTELKEGLFRVWRVLNESKTSLSDAYKEKSSRRRHISKLPAGVVLLYCTRWD